MTLTSRRMVTSAPRIMARLSGPSASSLTLVSASCLMGSSRVVTGTWSGSLTPNLFRICTVTVYVVPEEVRSQ